MRSLGLLQGFWQLRGGFLDGGAHLWIACPFAENTLHKKWIPWAAGARPFEAHRIDLEFLLPTGVPVRADHDIVEVGRVPGRTWMVDGMKAVTDALDQNIRTDERLSPSQKGRGGIRDGVFLCVMPSPRWNANFDTAIPTRGQFLHLAHELRVAQFRRLPQLLRSSCRSWCPPSPWSDGCSNQRHQEACPVRAIPTTRSHARHATRTVPVETTEIGKAA